MTDVDATITDGRPPPAEHEIDEALVRWLLTAQHPDLADRELRYVTDGSRSPCPKGPRCRRPGARPRRGMDALPAGGARRAVGRLRRDQ